MTLVLQVILCQGPRKTDHTSTSSFTWDHYPPKDKQDTRWPLLVSLEKDPSVDKASSQWDLGSEVATQSQKITPLYESRLPCRTHVSLPVL